MTSALRTLATVVVMLLAVAAPSHAYAVRSGDIYQVPEIDRISAKQVFARDADIVSAGYPYIKLNLFLHGRVYIRHVANDTAVADGVVGRIRVSGDKAIGIEHINLPEVGSSIQADIDNTLSLDAMYVDGDGSNLASVLIDIELYMNHSLRDLTSSGTADIVILENLLSPSTNATNEADDTVIDSRPMLSNMMPGKIFVSDPTADFSTSAFSVYTKGPSTIQLDVASLKSAELPELLFSVAPESNVTLFASKFVSPVRMRVWGENETLTRNPLCVATKDDVEFLFSSEMETDNPKESVISGGSICSKLPLPPREPALIGGLSVDEAFGAKEANIPTFPLPKGASSKASTPTYSPASSAASTLVILLPLFLVWQ